MDKFDFTYSAPTDAERKDVPSEKDTLLKLRELDKKVRLPAEILAYVLGILGTLILGTGMSMSMTDIGGGMVWGSVVGIIGIVMLSVNYKIYKYVLNRRKNKYADEIKKLTDGND